MLALLVSECGRRLQSSSSSPLTPLLPYSMLTTSSHVPCQLAQELLSTFSTSLGEVALQPSTGGIFVVKLCHVAAFSEGSPFALKEHLLWDRKAEGGFPGLSIRFSSSCFLFFSCPVLLRQRLASITKVLACSGSSFLFLATPPLAHVPLATSIGCPN